MKFKKSAAENLMFKFFHEMQQLSFSICRLSLCSRLFVNRFIREIKSFDKKKTNVRLMFISKDN